MANRSDREQGQPNLSLRRHSLNNRMGPCSRTPSGPAVSTDCINRPDRRLHPTNATASIYLLQRGSHPQKHSSGGKNRLGNISKQGDRYLRGLFVAGALSVIRYAKIHGTGHRPWLTALLARRPTKVAAIALANKIARMVWAMMARGERYKEPVALAR